ncbi:MAG TPA: CHRD domain-containing protein [Allosphingosinicella sp.]|nr:CHRD domain-containing protein [Allosphingosinicella sp.]
MRNLTMAAGVTALMLALGCTTPGGQRARLAVTLTGQQVVPGPGDPDATGTAEVRVDPGQGRVCWDLTVRQTGAVTAAHIHRGAPGTSGPPAVPLTTPDAGGQSQGCTPVEPALLAELARQAHDFYVNVHTAEHPQGAIRGQLRGGPIRRERQPLER